MNNSTHNSEIGAFESAVRQCFSFLESDHAFHFSGVREVNDGPRDTGVVARYRNDTVRIDIGWSAIEGSLAVLMHMAKDDLSRAERFAYLEPFIEFRTNGSVMPVVPQIYPGMSVRKIEEAMELRAALFGNGLDEALKAVALRLKEHYPTIRDASSDMIRQYHQWYRGRGKAGN